MYNSLQGFVSAGLKSSRFLAERDLRMKQKIYLLLVLIFSLWLSLPASAVVTLDAAIISSGGALNLQGGGYTLHDLKGQPVIGSSTSSGLTLDLGGIYVLTAGGIVTEPGVPYGTVPLTITRDGANIVLSWDAKYVNPTIYFMTGNGTGQFFNIYSIPPVVPTPWKIAYSNGSPANGFTFSNNKLYHPSQVGQGESEAYYKGLQNGVSVTALSPDVPQKTIFETVPAVGKLNLETAGAASGKWSFISSPLTNSSYDNMFGTDFSNGDQIWIWNDAEQKFLAPISFSAGTWGTGTITRGKGYLLNLKNPTITTSTIIGQVNLSASSRPISVKAGTPSIGWNLIGNPFPIASNMEGLTTGLSGVGDSLWQWDTANQKFLAPASFNGTAWPANTVLSAGRGYGYNRLGATGFDWTIPGKN